MNAKIVANITWIIDEPKFGITCGATETLELENPDPKAKARLVVSIEDALTAKHPGLGRLLIAVNLQETGDFTVDNFEERWETVAFGEFADKQTIK